MRHYELVTILSPMLNQEDASATWDEIKTFISNRDGEITAEQVWGTRRLAYPIRKGNYNFLEGSYYLSSFTSDNSFNRDLENYLRLHDNVLRSLVVRCDGPLADRPAPGPLTAPSRYVPPGRGRRDGGGPMSETSGGFAERGPAPTQGLAPSVPAAAATGTAASAGAPAGVSEVAAAPVVPDAAVETAAEMAAPAVEAEVAAPDAAVEMAAEMAAPVVEAEVAAPDAAVEMAADVAAPAVEAEVAAPDAAVETAAEMAAPAVEAEVAAASDVTAPTVEAEPVSEDGVVSAEDTAGESDAGEARA